MKLNDNEIKNFLEQYKELSISELLNIAIEIVSKGRVEKDTPERKMVCYTGKLGVISYCKVLSEKLDMSEDEWNKIKLDLEEKLPGGMYRITEEGWEYCGTGLREQINTI